MLRYLFKVFLIIIIINVTGCAVALSPFSSHTFNLYTSKRFTELNKFLTRDDGTLSSSNRKRILNDNIDRIKKNKTTTFEFIRYRIDIKYYIETLIEFGQFDQALKFCDDALHESLMLSDLFVKYKYRHNVTIEFNCSQIYDLLHLKGYIVWFISDTGDKKNALKIFNEVTAFILKVPDRGTFDSTIQKKLIFLSNNAMFYEKIIGDYKKALEIYKQVLTLSETLSFTSIDMKYGFFTQTYQRIMNLHMRLGELQQAKETLDEYQLLTNSFVYKIGGFIVRQMPRWRDDLAIIYADTGKLYSLLEEKDKAFEYFNKAWDIVKKIKPETHNGHEREAIGRYYVLNGTYYKGYLQENYDEAIKDVDKGISFLSPFYYSRIIDHFDLEMAYLNSGELHFCIKDFDNALQQAQKAMDYSEKTHNKIIAARTNILIGKIWQQRNNIQRAKASFEIANRIIEKEHVESTENYELYRMLGQVYEYEDANQALKFYKEAVGEVENLWQGRFDDTPKQVSFIDNRLIVFEPVINILTRQGKYEEALYYMERSKSRTIYETSPYYSPNEDTKYDKNIFNPISSVQLKKLVADNTAFLEYYVGEDSIFAAVISKNGVHVKELKGTVEELKTNVTAFRLAIESQKYPYEKWGSKLYSILIEPFLEYIPDCESLCIIPHGVLHNLPFQALVIDKSKSLFLIDKYKLSYAPSLAILSFAINSKHNNKTDFLGIGNSLEVNIKDLNLKDKLGRKQDKLGRLSFVRDEVLEVSSLFIDNDKTVLIDNKATKTAVQKNSSRADIILFSAHAALLRREPLKSCIFLNKEYTNNGRLTISDIEKLDLNATLVILSACETGLVSTYEECEDLNEYELKFPFGDDLVSLQRAFIKAGSSSILSTLWRVNDKASKSLVINFVKEYKDGKDKATALRNAVLKVKGHNEKSSNTIWEHPYYWAPFILSGDWG